MHFTQIELYNFGLYKNSHIISLKTKESKKNITLIGGLNGRGKTTILEAIFIAFYGKRAMKAIQDKRNVSYSKMLNSRVNKDAVDNQTFVNVVFMLDEKKEFSVKRSWKKQEKSTADILEVKVNGIYDSVLSLNWNFYVEEILPISIARFFFFDNERISQIAEDESFEEIKSSIKSIMGISTVDILITDVKKLLKEKEGELNETGNEELRKEQNEIKKERSKIKKNIEHLIEQKDKLESEIASLSVKIEECEDDFWKEGGILGTDKERFEKNKEELNFKKGEIATQMQGLINDTASPLYICRDLAKSALLKFEKSEKALAQKYSLGIIIELKEKLFEKIQHSFKEAGLQKKLYDLIEDEFQQYLGDEGQCVDFSMSQLSADLLKSLDEHGFTEIQQTCKRLMREYDNIDEELVRVNAHLSNDVDEMELKEQFEEIRSLEEVKSAKSLELEILDKEEASLNGHLKEIDRKASVLLNQLAEAEKKVTDTTKVIKYATITLEVMDEFKRELQRSKVDKLQKNITKCFKYLAGKNNMITEVSINSETLDIYLMDSQSKELLKSQLSAGEKQIFAVSVLWGLAVSSGYEMPVVIDTPMARLDSVHRRNFVSKYLPNASDQVVVLSTDEEIYGEYLDEVGEFVNAYYTLEYDEKNETTSIKEGYFGKKICS